MTLIELCWLNQKLVDQTSGNAFPYSSSIFVKVLNRLCFALRQAVPLTRTIEGGIEDLSTNKRRSAVIVRRREL